MLCIYFYVHYSINFINLKLEYCYYKNIFLTKTEYYF